jgi:hypothetical protein
MCGCHTPPPCFRFALFCLTALILYDIMTTRRPMKRAVMIYIYNKHHDVNNGFFSCRCLTMHRVMPCRVWQIFVAFPR